MKIDALKIENLLSYTLSVLLFLLPWQTIWITQERYLNGVKWEYGTPGFYAIEGLLWITIVFFTIWYFIDFRFQISDFRFRWTKDRIFLLSLLSLILYYLLSILWAPDKQLALQQSLHVIEAALFFLILLLGPLTLDKAAKWFIAGAIIQAILGIYQFLTQSTFSSTLLGLTEHPAWQAGVSILVSDGGRWLRAYGAFPHPNILGGYLAIALLMLPLLKPAAAPQTKPISHFSFLISNSPITYHLSLITLTAGIFFTFSRSAWLALTLTLILFFFLNRKKLYHSIAVAVSVFIILSSIFWPLVQTRFSNNTQNEIVSVNERVSGYKEALTLWRKHPWLGVGAGNYTLASYRVNPNRPGWQYQPVHNVPLLMIAELGIVGALSFLISLFSFLLWCKSIKFRIANLLVIALPLLPLLFFDHYLYSLLSGLELMAIYIAFALSIPILSTPYPRQQFVEPISGAEI